MAEDEARRCAARSARAFAVGSVMLAACAPVVQAPEIPTTLVIVPTQPSAEGTSTGPIVVEDPVSFAPRVQPIPEEPQPPPAPFACTRETVCRDGDDAPPPTALPAPYDRCPASYGRASAAGAASARAPAAFSLVETRAARRLDPDACCYVEYRDCS